jgi:hypothetical protein
MFVAQQFGGWSLYAIATLIAVVGVVALLVAKVRKGGRAVFAAEVSVFGFAVANVLVTALYILGILLVYGLPRRGFPYERLFAQPAVAILASWSLWRYVRSPLDWGRSAYLWLVAVASGAQILFLAIWR